MTTQEEKGRGSALNPDSGTLESFGPTMYLLFLKPQFPDLSCGRQPRCRGRDCSHLSSSVTVGGLEHELLFAGKEGPIRGADRRTGDCGQKALESPSPKSMSPTPV